MSIRYKQNSNNRSMKLAILDYSEAKIFLLDYNGEDDSEMIEEALTKAGFNLDEIEWMSSAREINIEEHNIKEMFGDKK